MNIVKHAKSKGILISNILFWTSIIFMLIGAGMTMIPGRNHKVSAQSAIIGRVDSEIYFITVENNKAWKNYAKELNKCDARYSQLRKTTLEIVRLRRIARHKFIEISKIEDDSVPKRLKSEVFPLIVSMDIAIKQSSETKYFRNVQYHVNNLEKFMKGI